MTGYAAYDAHHSGTRVFWVGGHGTGSVCKQSHDLGGVMRSYGQVWPGDWLRGLFPPLDSVWFWEQTSGLDLLNIFLT